MQLKRVIMILGASLEFEKKFNSDIVERETDEFEMPKVFIWLIIIVNYLCKVDYFSVACPYFAMNLS